MKKNKAGIRELWDTIKCNNIYIIEVLNKREGETNREHIQRNDKNFPNLGKKLEI